MFEIILATDHNTDIALNITPKALLLPSINNNSKYSSSKLRKRSEIVSPSHQLQNKSHKAVNDYSTKCINYFNFVVAYPSPKIIDQEMEIIATSFMNFSQEQMILNTSKTVHTHLLKHWNGNKSSAHTSMNASEPSEHVDMKVFSIELK